MTRLYILGFALGVCLLQLQSALPPLTGALALAPLAVSGLWLRQRGPAGSPGALTATVLLCIACVAAGFFYAAARAEQRMSDRLAPEWEGPELQLTGVVADLPQAFDGGIRFEFDVESAAPPEARLPARVALSWYNGTTREEFQDIAPMRAGERWRFPVRLRRPHGSSNPHGFDYEAWLLERSIGATGYVRPGDHARLDDLAMHPAYWVERAREILRERFWDALPQRPHAGILVALAVGDQKAIDARQWQLFARTGVSHLMSISGLHVTMVASLFASLAYWLWRRSDRLLLALPAQKAAALAGLAAAFAYCLIAGFAVPAQRTLYMVGVVALALWLGRLSSVSSVLCLALLAVLVLDPWAGLSPGFWLSFGAVAVILYVVTGRGRPGHWLVQWARVQWAITLALTPLLLVLFQQVSLVSPLANAVAIPVVSLVVTPLALAGCVLPFDFILDLAHWVMAAQMELIEWMGSWPVAVWQQHAPAPWEVAAALAGTAWLLLPRGMPARWLGLPLLLPLFCVAPPGPAQGALWLTVLDVGQGLAVFAQTGAHALLYDAGPAFGPDADSGARVILPYLRAAGVERLDAVIVTHNDNDHAGGAASVLAGIPAGQLLSSLPEGHPARDAGVAYDLPCHAGRRWDWDGVRFEMLHPTAASYAIAALKPNDRSCVLKITTAHGTVLLTSDIEASSEEELLDRRPDDLRADVLVVPHHGSRTSSTAAFIDAVRPGWALFPVGYRNRFGHPKDDVVERYRAAGARLARTDADGAIQVRLEGGAVSVQPYRAQARRYWHSG